MSLQNLLDRYGVPAGVAILTSTYTDLQSVKLYKRRCKDMSDRCVSVMVALQEGVEGLEGDRALEVADEVEVVIRRIDRKVKEWASWNRLKSFLQRNEIKDGIDRLQRDIDAVMVKFSVRINMELARGHMESQAIQELDKEEIREVLQTIVESTDDMRVLMNMQSSRPVEEIMESLQTELMDPSLQPRQEQSFREGLRLLQEKTANLPPSTDLTGQVTVNTGEVVAKGALKDVYKGQWLGKEQVAVRLPRALPNIPEDAMGRTTTDVQPTPTAPEPPKSQAPAPLHPEIHSVVKLTIAHAHKIYFSGPLVRLIEREADGQRPTKDEGWIDVWAQLGGTTLSIWDMKEIQEASKQGREVPPTYVNVMDAFVQILGSVTVPATATSGPKRYTNVLTLNTAGSNLLLFSCPSTNALISWAAALRLSAWEKSRLEEIYTSHLIRITLSAPDTPTTLVRGRMEGWARIRIAGQTDWKRVWMVVSASVDGAEGTASPPAPNPTLKRMSSLFSRDQSLPQPTGPTKASISMYLSPRPKDRKRALLTVTNVTQVFSIYPERPELISRSTLIKVEGLLGDEELAAGMRSREGWLLVMPELDPNGGQAAGMLKWIVAMHDAFSLYGRPKAWSWDPRDRTSMMFAYPVGPQKESLFLERDLVESVDPRDDRTSVIRSRLIDLVVELMPPAVQPVKMSDGRD